MLKARLYNSLERMGWLGFCRPQSFDAVYGVSLVNRSDTARSGYLGIPMPLDTEYQVLVKPSVFDWEDVSLQHDLTYGNPYAVVGFDLPPGQTLELKQSFTVRVSPRTRTMTYPKAESKEFDRYARTTDHLHPFDSAIKQLLKRFGDDKLEVGQRVKVLNNFVIHHLLYGHPIDGLYSDLEAIERKTVDCGGFSALLISLCVASNIPARLVSGFWAGHQDDGMHAWVEYYQQDRGWVAVDPSIEHLKLRHRTVKSGHPGFVGSDRIVFSVGCDMEVEIAGLRRTIDIMQHPFVVSERSTDGLVSRAIVTTRKIW